MNETLSEILKLALIAAIPVVGKLCNSGLTMFQLWLETKIHNEKLLTVEREAMQIVQATTQTVVTSLKNNGGWNAQAADDVKKVAMAQLRDRLKGLALPDLEQRLEHAVESAVGSSK